MSPTTPPKLEKVELRATCPDTEYDVAFLQGMLNRMSVSYLKYGAIADAFPAKVDALASLQQRLDKYNETGNTEWLIDAANLAMIEAKHPGHPNAHFKGTDSGESPGRTSTTGKVNTLDNRRIS